jgi:hypothetical protein
MEVIHVPPPSREAFDKSRPMSDLIKSQVKHFKHLEEKLSPEQRMSIPQHRITTENDAAQYIAAMTRFLRQGTSEPAAKKTTGPIEMKPPKRKTSLEGLAIAASAEAEGGKPKPKSSRKKSAK